MSTNTEEIRVIHKFKPFILGFCACNCDQEIKIKSASYLKKYIKHHHQIGKKSHNYKNGRTMKEGYWMIYLPDYFSSDKAGYVAEHIYFYQEKYKLCMLPWGDVHHIIPIKRNGSNLPWNLDGMMHGKHQNLHHIKDISKRFCSICKSKKTQIRSDNGRPHWFNDKKGGWLCQKCYRRVKYNS